MTPTGDPLASSRFIALSDVIRSRRTSLFVDPDQGVTTEVIDALCELARWAPCHKRTWPWVFASFAGDARRRLGDAVTGALEDADVDEARVSKARTKYLRAPVVLVVGAQHGDDPTRTAENRDATAAAVEHILLAATAVGLASYWSSCPRGADAAVAALAGFSAPVTIVAMIYLGWPLRACPVPERPDAAVIHLR